MRHILIILAIMLFMFGCRQTDKDEFPPRLNGALLSELVIKAINNDTTANNKLANIIDSMHENRNFNSLTIDSVDLLNDDTYYYVLLEYPNPLYNRLAVYNSSYFPLLIDESLNGNIFIDKIESGKKQFIKTDEAFISKDTLILNRLSLYEVDPAGISLSLRILTKFVKPDIEFTQDITGLTDSLVITKIKSSKKSPVDNKEDRFVYVQSQKKYLSQENIFDEFVKKEIENFNYEPKQPAIKEDL